MKTLLIVRSGAICALLGVVVLTAMMFVGLPAAEGMAVLGQATAPEAFAASIRPVARVILLAMALDNIFVIAYSGAFIGATALVWRRARLWGMIGLAFALILALLDLGENAVTVTLAQSALSAAPIAPAHIFLLGFLTQIKFASGGLAVAFIAIALLIFRPKNYPLIVGTAVLYLLFPILNGIATVKPAAQMLLIVGMWLMLLLSAPLLWRYAPYAEE
jgi:hypothetical protein